MSHSKWLLFVFYVSFASGSIIPRNVARQRLKNASLLKNINSAPLTVIDEDASDFKNLQLRKFATIGNFEVYSIYKKPTKERKTKKLTAHKNFRSDTVFPSDKISKEISDDTNRYRDLFDKNGIIYLTYPKSKTKAKNKKLKTYKISDLDTVLLPDKISKESSDKTVSYRDLLDNKKTVIILKNPKKYKKKNSVKKWKAQEIPNVDTVLSDTISKEISDETFSIKELFDKKGKSDLKKLKNREDRNMQIFKNKSFPRDDMKDLPNVLNIEFRRNSFMQEKVSATPKTVFDFSELVQ